MIAWSLNKILLWEIQDVSLSTLSLKAIQDAGQTLQENSLTLHYPQCPPQTCGINRFHEPLYNMMLLTVGKKGVFTMEKPRRSLPQRLPDFGCRCLQEP